MSLTAITVLTMLVLWSFALVSKTLWLPLLISLENVIPILLLVTAILSAQFNRSRFSILCLSWLLLFFTKNYQLPWSIWLAQNNAWLTLSILFLFVTLSLIKDRALFSIHGVVRLTLIIGCGGLAYLWLLAVQYLSVNVEGEYALYLPLSFIEFKLPLVLCGVFLLSRSLINRDLFQSCLLVSYIIWAVYAVKIDIQAGNQLELLPWLLALSLLVIQYLLAVIVDAYYLAYRDDLTALPSRRALNQYALSLGRKYTVAMLDIDHFKKFNDTYGHDVGDQVLRLVASKLAKVKGGGRVFRYGGEEFTVVFAKKTLSDSLPELEILRQSIAGYKIAIRQPQRSAKKTNKKSTKIPKKTSNKTVGVTISIGVAEHQTKQRFDQCLKAADQALYQAKKNGRNNVSH